MIYNRCKAVDVKYNVDIISPPDYFTFEEQNYKSDLEVMKYYLRHTKSSDLIIVNFNDPKSVGTAQEIAVAYDRNIPIVGMNFTDEKLNPWLTCSCDRIFDNYSDLVNYVFKFYLT
jgi:nucleoside 2-deoxyribosyltransferase